MAIGLLVPIAHTQYAACRFGQAVGNLLGTAQQHFVLAVVVGHIGPCGFYDSLQMLTLHLQMLQTIEARIAYGSIEPGIAVLVVQRGVALPSAFKHIAHDIPGLIGIGHQGRCIAHKLGVHLHKQRVETLLLVRGLVSTEYRQFHVAKIRLFSQLKSMKRVKIHIVPRPGSQGTTARYLCFPLFSRDQHWARVWLHWLCRTCSS